jgi:hypothetical protein
MVILPVVPHANLTVAFQWVTLIGIENVPPKTLTTCNNLAIKFDPVPIEGHYSKPINSLKPKSISNCHVQAQRI